MTDAHMLQFLSDLSDQSDPLGILRLFRSYIANGTSDQSDRVESGAPVGPSGPTADTLCRTRINQQIQCGPTGPTGPTASLTDVPAAYPDGHLGARSETSATLEWGGALEGHADKTGSRDQSALDGDDLLDLDAFEERAAICQYDGGQPRIEAETSAMAEVASALGMTPDRLRHRWYAHPDAQRYLGLVDNCGCLPLDAAARVLGWTLERTWAADARLRACGVVRDGRLVSANTFRGDLPSGQVET